MSGYSHTPWFGHPTTQRTQLAGGAWEYVDPRNQDLAFEIAKLGVHLPELDATIEALEARGHSLASELRMRRSRLIEERAKPAGRLRHLQWIGKRLAEIEGAVSKPAFDASEPATVDMEGNASILGASGDAMDAEQKFPYWVEVSEVGTVKFCDLPVLIANALHSTPIARGAARINLEQELSALVRTERLTVRDPLTHGPHPFPHGNALLDAVLLPIDLPPLLNPRGIGLRLMPKGAGPIYWTIDNAAAAIAAQEGWHARARDTLRDQMMQAAREGRLPVRHPHTGLIYRPEVVRSFYELVTPADINDWLALDPGSMLRWGVATAATAEPAPVTSTGDAAQPGSMSADTIETPEDRDDRRYRELKADGGDYVEEDGKWHATGQRGLLAKLVRREQSDRRPMSDEKDVRASLKRAVKRAKAANALGLKGNSVFNR